MRLTLDVNTRLCNCLRSLASSLESRRKGNQLSEASCNTCGGRFLVDGVGPISGSMLGTTSLEVTNSINPESSWKTVTKGKRSQKAVARSLNGRVGLRSKSPKRVGDFSGFDSDKFGETAIGNCSPNKIECVPIKKRRHFLRSPSASSQPSLYDGQSASPQLQTPCSHSEDLEHLLDHYGSSGQQSSGSYSNRRGSVTGGVSNHDDGRGDKVSELPGVEHNNSDNFSGIALLAAAACIDNLDDPYNDREDVMEVSSAPQRSDAPTSSEQLGESISWSESGKQMHKDLSWVENKGCSFVVEASTTAPHSADENEENRAVNSVSSKVQRWHWDLNTLMDAWKQPNEDSVAEYTCIDTSIDGMQRVKLGKEDCGIQWGSRSNENDAESHLPLDQIKNVNKSSPSKVKENELEEFVYHDRSNMMETSFSNLNEHSMEPLNSPSADTKVFGNVHRINESTDNLPLFESCHSLDISSGKAEAKAGCVAIIGGDDSCRNEIVSSSPDTSELNVALPEATDLEKFRCDNDAQVKDGESTGKISELADNRTATMEEMYVDTCKTLDVDNSESTSEDNSHPSLSKSEGLSTSDIFVGGESAVFCNAEAQDEKVLAANTLGTDVGVDSASKELPSKHENPRVSNGEAEERSILHDSGKGLVLDDCHNSDVSQDDRSQMDGRDSSFDLQVGYDSPYEDGELRGSVLYSCEGNEIEDGEHECLDYESDGRGGEDSDTGDYPGSKIVEAGSQGSQGTKKKSSLAVQFQETVSRKSSSVKSSLRRELKEENAEKIQTVGKKGSDQGSGTTEELCADVIADRNDVSVRRRHTLDHMDVLDVEASYVREVGSKTTRGKLPSRIEGPSDTFEREVVYNQQSRSRNCGGSYSRGERDCTPDRFATRYRSNVHERERIGGDGRLISWNSRNHNQSSYRVANGHGPRQRYANTDSDKFGGVNSHYRKQFISYSSRAERDSSPDKLATRNRSAVHEFERIGGDGHQLANWDSRNHNPSRYRSPEGHGQSRPRSAIDGEFNSHDHKQSINYSSKSIQRPLGWRRASIDGDEYHGGQRSIEGDSHQLAHWDSRNHNPSRYGSPEGHGQSRPRSAIADSVDGEFNSHDHKQSINYSSKSIQRPLGWRSAPIDGDEYHGGQRRMAGISNNRNRCGSRNFSEGVGRGRRVDCHHPVDDDAASSVRMPHYLSIRERRFFPPSMRGAHVSVPHRNSRSRSRTRSPRAWEPEMEGNLGTRRHSRSPDFWSEGRMGRMRGPFQKPGFAADYGESCMSPPRGRSPERNFRGVDDGNFVDSNLRHQRSPLNVFRQRQGQRQRQRLNFVGLSGRFKSDDSFKPMMRPGRFPSMAGVEGDVSWRE